jgi:N6-L-threonylcarbamoyladenine synthase
MRPEAENEIELKKEKNTGDLRVLGIESTAHTFSAAVVSGERGLLCDVRDIYAPPEGSGIHPTEASVHHAAVAAKVVKEAMVA